MDLPRLIADRYAGNNSALARALTHELRRETGRADAKVNPTTVRRWLLDPADRHYREPSRRYRKLIERLAQDDQARDAA